MSLGLPFPQEEQPEPPVNIILQALEVKAYMRAHPDETCLSAAEKLNLNRRRISRLLQFIDILPQRFIKEAKNYTDPRVLRALNVKTLSHIACYATDQLMEQKLRALIISATNG